MPDTGANGGANDHEKRISKLEEARQEIEDTLLVMAHLESKAGERIKQHAEFIVSHETALRFHAASMAEFDGKLNVLIDIISRRQGGMESRS